MPPLATTVAEYAFPSEPPGKEVVMITRPPATFIVILSGFVAVSRGVEESVTLTVKLDIPDVVGVPEITPVLGVSLSPAGKVPTEIDHV